MMEKKRSKGVIIFGILFILGLFTGIADKIFIAFPKPTLSIIDWSLKVVAVIGLFAAVGLFMKKELARKVILAIVSIHTVFPLLQIPFIDLDWIIRTGSRGSLITASDFAETRPFAIGALIIIFMIKIIWSGAFIFYLTRPKVKEQFR